MVHVQDRVETLDFGLATVSAAITQRAEARQRNVVVNLDDSPAVIDGDVPGHLPPRQSTIITGSTVRGALLLEMSAEPALTEAAARAAGWNDFYSDRADQPVLLRSPQHAVGVVHLDAVRASTGSHGPAVPHEVFVNLWFSPAGTDCGRHRVHPFLEFHTQICGTGAMEKFHTPDAPEPYEEQLLAPGSSGAAAFSRFDPANRSYVYPWHQYRAVTDAVWAAIEYYPLQEDL